MKKINYQIMGEENKNSHGLYIPDWDELIRSAGSKEEADYIKETKANIEKWENDSFMKSAAGFAFNMVYIFKQGCGCYGMFQHPVRSEEEAIEWIEARAKEADKMTCVSCLNRSINQAMAKERTKREGKIKKWTECLPEDVHQRLCSCQTKKSDIETLVGAKWHSYKEHGKDKAGFTKEDALIAVLELLECNSQSFDLTRGEYDSLIAQ